MREVVNINLSVFDIQPGLICVQKSAVPMLEQVFGQQAYVKKTETSVCYDSIKVRRRFSVAVWKGEIVRAEGILLDDEDRYWAVDVPDLSEYIDVSNSLVVALRMLILMESVPLRAIYRTHVTRVSPAGAKGIYPGWYKGVLGMRYEEGDTYAVSGYGYMFIVPEQVL